MNNCSFSPADILVPKKIDGKWPVIACDQYTSEPEYWENVKNITVDSNTTYNMILPECYLSGDNSERINAINNNMNTALDNGIFDTYNDSLFYIERTQSDGKIRRGIVGKIDLEAYDYLPDSNAEIRATEKTVLSRIPPRVAIRKDAPLEFPHAMLLFDDPENTVIKKATDKKELLKEIYNIDLMKNAGHINGYLIDDELKSQIISSLCKLKEKNGGFLFCVGDGNHSLACAKECHNLSKTEESRYALVEIVNIHDEALEFEPIYRVVFGADSDKIINDFLEFCGGAYSGDNAQKFTVITGNGDKEISVKPVSELPVGTLQTFLDKYEYNIDYIHGEQSLRNICKKESGIGFIFEGMKKSELFTAVNNDGSLPRKTFSMGHADDKRFYLEGRKIK